MFANYISEEGGRDLIPYFFAMFFSDSHPTQFFVSHPMSGELCEMNVKDLATRFMFNASCNAARDMQCDAAHLQHMTI